MKKQDRWVVAVFLILSLTAAQVSTGGEDSPMARAPLPPPLPAAPQQSGSTQAGTQSQTRQREPLRPHRSVERGMSAAYLHKRTHRPRRLDRSSLAARSEGKHPRRPLGDVERAGAYPDRQIASTMIPPFAPPPPFGYNPDVPPGYGYGRVYPPLWLPGPAPPR